MASSIFLSIIIPAYNNPHELEGLCQSISYQLIEKPLVIGSIIKTTSKRGVYAKIDDENNVFIPKESAQFSLAGDEVEILLFPKKKNRFILKRLSNQKKKHLEILLGAV